MQLLTKCNQWFECRTQTVHFVSRKLRNFSDGPRRARAKRARKVGGKTRNRPKKIGGPTT